jgi:cell division protein FtsB
MAKGFEKGALIVLVLVFLVGIAFTYHVIKQQKTIEDVVCVTDARTEYLYNEVQNLSKRVDKLEKTK